MLKNTNLLFLFKILLGDEAFKKCFRYRSLYSVTLKSPVVFYIILSFLDDETTFELKYVRVNLTTRYVKLSRS
jgi:hypothetical protein